MLITVNQLWNLVNCEIPLFPIYFLYTALFSGLSISCSLDCLMGNFAMLSLQFVDDLILLGVRAGGGSNVLQKLDSENQTRGLLAVYCLQEDWFFGCLFFCITKPQFHDTFNYIDLLYSLDSIPSCPPEDMFLCRLLQVNSIESSSKDGILQYVEEALASRHSSARELMKFIEEVIDAQRVKTKSIAEAFHEKLSAEGQKILIVWSNCYFVFIIYVSYDQVSRL